MKLKTFFAPLAIALALAGLIGGQGQVAFGQTTTGSRTAGRFVAINYISYGQVTGGPYAAGSVSITLASGTITLPDGRTIIPYSVNAPLTIGNGGNSETVTPSAVSGCTFGAQIGSCTVTVSTSNTHGSGDTVTSGTAGLQEAINDAFQSGGGMVSVDQSWYARGGTSAIITAAVPYASVAIEDTSAAEVRFWRPTQNNVTTLATPTTLTTQAACDGTHTTCSDASAVGTWTAVANHFCVAYVDIMGNEGTCSADASFTTVVSKAVDVTAPAASAGAIGYKIYGGTTYAGATELPLSSTVCTLTKIETVTAACAVANTTYGQAASAAQIATIAVTTNKLALNATSTSSTTDYVGNPGSVTVYKYAPSARVGVSGLLSSYTFFPVGAAAATTVPNVVGTIVLPPGYMNFVGKSIRICGYATEASAGSTATISNFQLWWDANGSDTATGVPILVGTNPMTNTLVTAKTDQFQFCYDLRTTVAGASTTAGSIIQDTAVYQNQYTSSAVATVPLTVLGQAPAAVASLNLAGEARIHVVWLHTTGTDGAGVQLQRLTIQDIS